METPTNSQPVSEITPPQPAPPAPTPAEIKAYHKAKRVVHLSGIMISLLYWIAWCLLAVGFVKWLDTSIDSCWAGLAITVLVMLGGISFVSLPLDFYSDYILEKRYNLSNQTPITWLIFQIKTWIIGTIIGGIVLGGLYAALWYSGPLWGVWVWIGVMTLSIVLAKIFPLLILPLFYPAKPLDRPTLADRLKKLAGNAGMTITGIFDLGLSKDTKKANAMLAGLGSSRRVYLSDTLLEAFNDDEITIVFAHELGHHIRKHIFKGIALAAVVSSLLVSLLYWRLNPYASNTTDWSAAVATFAQVMLIMSVFPLLTGPVTNAIARYFERQADTDALQLTNDPNAFRSTFELLAKMNMADPNPPLWEVIMFDDHPPISKRIAMADEYKPKT